MAGMTVVHRRLGPGVAVDSRHGGFELRVEFGGGVVRWIRSDELEMTPDKTSTKLVSERHRATSAPAGFRHRRMVESFRLGIVPDDCVNDFTFGREAEAAQLRKWLSSPDSSAVLVVGDYGIGKTHLLRYVRSLAEEDGFATAFVELDSQECNFRQPKRVYHRITRSLRYRTHQDLHTKGFRDLLDTCRRLGGLADHAYFRWLESRRSDRKVWEWLEASARPPRPTPSYQYSLLPGMYDSATAANVYCYLLSGLAWAAMEGAGLPGLVLFLDEAEAIDQYNYPYQQYRGANFLTAMVRVAQADETLTGTPTETTLDYCKWADEIPFVYEPVTPFKLVMGVAPSPALHRDPLRDLERIEIAPLADDALRSVFEHICLLYYEAYGYLEDDHWLNKVFDGVASASGRTRMFVKGSVEALDLSRFGRWDGHEASADS